MGTASLLVVGHITRDLLSAGTFRLGGTAYYAGIAAIRLGHRVSVYTAARPDLDFSPLHEAAPGIEIYSLPSSDDTVFSNRYQAGRRRQLLLGRARPLSIAGLPGAWRAAPLVLLGAVAGEISPAWTEALPGAVVGACLQGWLRAWDASGRVSFRPWSEAARWLPRLAAAFLSEEDVQGRQDLVERYAAHCPLLVQTAGERGATLYESGRPRAVAPFPVRERDPTGAGDVFAAAFLVRRAEGAAPAEAARFAAAAAALSVRAAGAEAIPWRGEVEALLQEAGDVVAFT